MKANTNMNRSLFRTFGGSTNSLSSSIVLCHPIATPGQYAGVAYKNNQVLGRFTVTCNDSAPHTQADVDLAKLDPAGQSDCDCHANLHYEVKPKGYLVLYSSTGTAGFHVELTLSAEKAGSLAYTTKKPVSGDIVLCTLMRPGSYQLTDSRNQTCTLLVGMPDDKKSADSYKAEDHTVVLTERGFSSEAIQTVPTQPIIVALETNSSVEVKLIEPYQSDEPESPTKHRWQKPSPRRSAS